MAVAERPTLKENTAPPASDAPRIAVKNPITGATLGTIPVQDAAQVRDAVERAREAQPAWHALGVKERARLLLHWSDVMWENHVEFYKVIRDETGKTEAGAFGEFAVIANVVAYYASSAPKLLKPQRRKALLPLVYHAKVYFEPFGVVGAITPWNYPYFNLLTDVIPALIAGNTVVIKPSEVTPFTALYAIEKIHAAGIPRDAIQIVTGAGDTGRALINEVDYVTFTGSTGVGRKVAIQCAERLIPYSLELGGKDAMIVLNDADLDQAALSALRGGMENAGQVCASIERIYVEAGVHDAFVEKLRTHANNMVCRPGDGYDIHMGSLTNERELIRVEEHVRDAVEKGATVLAGGERLAEQGPLFYAPTVLTGVDHRMKVMREETFGPVLPVMKVKDADEAIRMANDSPYGLSGAVFSRDERRATDIARRMKTGDVSINGTQLVFLSAASTMGGFKESGIGRRGGPEGLMRYVQPQAIIADRVPIKNTDLILANGRTRLIVEVIRRLRKIFPSF